MDFLAEYRKYLLANGKEMIKLLFRDKRELSKMLQCLSWWRLEK